ncbi:MAG: hydroxymethylbilane synthase [Bdellovibrionales bacterium]|nr:hydroxymethylbilane synthase [Oligoflexia bacterium]
MNSHQVQTSYRLGTRKSLLAIAQSSWVARELERLNPGITIELVGIETKGDVILDKPLSQVEGKEFFTAELDLALIRGDVDLTVHSMKDLSLERPPQLKLAATPTREFAHDIIVFHESTTERLQKGEAIRIGTSSPRRLALIPEFLKNALPRFNSHEPRVQFVEIRGNVNTRLSRVHEEAHSEKKLDGVVLAFAGLERLAMDANASIELYRLLEHTKMMIVPLNICPSAPAQGALAIEARAEATETLSMIQKIHNPATLAAVQEERKILGEWGGGCHQKLGASLIAPGVLSIKGQKHNGDWVNEFRGEVKNDFSAYTKVEASDVFNFRLKPLTHEESALLKEGSQVFVAHSRAFDFLENKSVLTNKRVWVSGHKSWFKIAAQGIWVEGCLEGMGFQFMPKFQQKKLLRLSSSFLFLTHLESAPTPGTTHLATYSHEFREIPQKAKDADQIFWSSGLPFQVLWSKLGADFWLKKKHASGPGKTAQLLKETLTPHGVNDVSTFQS